MIIISSSSSLWEFSSSALADGLSLESDRHQVSLSLPESTQYSDRSQ